MGQVMPMLPSAVDALPVGPGWIFEFKWDGVRTLLDVSDRGVRLTSRLGNDVSAAYPEIVALAETADDALIDGEIVAFDSGRPSFELLQTRMHVRSATEARRLAGEFPATFVAFDLLRRYGVDLTSRPLAERRATLERWLGADPSWTLSPSFDDGPATEEAARRHGLEGVVAKRSDAPYRPGARTPDWVKLRFLATGDFVVLGWESAADGPDVLSSLLLGHYRDDQLVFSGKVGSGLAHRTAADLQRRLVARPAGPAAPAPEPTRGRRTHWVEPEVVVEVSFSMWTGEGRLRQPVLRRLRPDKTPEEAHADG
jgi:bifunctional non-homologous end joining protein LigD